MVCVSVRSSSSSMAWRTLVSDGVADIAGICTVGSAGGALGAGAAARTGGVTAAAGLARAEAVNAGALTCAAIFGATTGGLAGTGRAAAGLIGAATGLG